MTGKKPAEGNDEAENATAETVPIEKLKASLEEIKEYEGVIGYILRNSTSATIDLKDPSKLIEYAILSASSLNAAEELSEIFNLGTAKNITVEGKNVKALSMIFGENKVSLFLEKNAEIEKIQEKLNSLKTEPQ